MTNIVLIGYRGTGKTIVGKKLADKLSRKLVEVDGLIVEKANMSIPEIVEKYGWGRFRDMESEVVREVSKSDNCVIDAGGGVVLRKENIDELRENGIIILLKADIKTIISRIEEDTQRPSLTGKRSFVEEVEEVLNQRKKMYEDAADYSIDTSKLTVDEVAIRIISYLKRKHVLK